MKRIISVYLMLICMLTSLAQNGEIGDFGPNNWSTKDDFTGSAGSSRIGTFLPNGTGNRYFRLVTNWGGNNNQWGPSSTTNDYQVTIKTEVPASEIIENSTSKAYYINVGNSSYNYVFKTKEGGNPPTNKGLIVFEVRGNISTVTGVSKDLTTVFPSQAVVVTATLNEAFSTGQGAYLRYTNDNWSTSSVLSMSGSGTSYSATIPSSANGASKTIQYYVFTSGDGITFSDATKSDWYTINLNNNSGSNYSYNVESSWTTAVAGSWSSSSTWNAGVVPVSNVPVSINHDVILDQDATIYSATISSEKTLTINSGKTLQTNYGITITGTLSVSGTLQINAGGFITNAPTYNSGSTLKYNSGGTYGRNTEWSTTSGAGYPYHVQISNSTTLDMGANGAGVARQCAGNLTVDVGSTFSMNVTAMTQAVTVLGDVSNSGTITLSSSNGGDLKLQGSLVDNGTFNANNRAVFFNGGNVQEISGSGTFDISYVRINKTGGNVKLLSNLLCEGPNGGNAMEIDGTSSILDLNGYTLTIGKASTSSTYNSGISTPGKIKGSSTSSISVLGTGAIGTFVFDQTTPGSTNLLQNLTLNRITAGSMTLGSDLVIGGTLTLTNGTFIVGANTLTISGNSPARSSGNINASNSSATLAFTNSEAISLPASLFTGDINNLTLNGSGGINLGATVTVAGTLSLSNGTLGVGTNTLTLNGTVSQTSGTISSSAAGTVSFNQATNGQSIPTGSYGNLSCSNFNKTLPSSGSVSIAGSFTPGSGTFTISGSTIIYNGTSSQTLPSGFTTYNNLTLNNSAGTSGPASLNVNGTLRVQAGTFTSHSTYNNVQIDNGATLTAADNITCSGTWTNNGTFTPGSYNVTFGGSSQQTLSGSSTTTFNNLEINNSNGLVLSASASVAGTLSMQTGLITSSGGSLSYGADGILEYNGSNYSSSTDIEFPETNGPKSLTITDANASGLTLHASRTLTGNLSIAASKKFIIPDGKSLTVDGTVTNNGGEAGLVIESGGSLKHNTANIDGTAKRTVTNANWTTAKDGWHFLSSPVASPAISPAFTSDPYDFYCWNEPTNEWVNFKNQSGGGGKAPFFDDVNGSNNFVTGKGYMVAYDAGGTKEFVGKINVIDVPFSNLTLSSNTNSGWHLLGNPFSCAITWDGSWTMSNISGVVKIWNESIQDYSDLTSDPASSIPATNGFLVQVTSGTNNITIPASKRAHSSQAYYKSTIPFIKLKATNPEQENAKESTIYFNPLSSNEFDIMYDGIYLAGFGPRFYSVSGNHHLSTNSLPELTSETVIPFHFLPNEGTVFTIEAENISGIEGPVYLTDLKNNTKHDLSLNPVYSFTSSTSDDMARFLLSFGNLNTDNKEGRAIKVFAYGRDIYFSGVIGNSGSQVFVYNMIGQLVAKTNLTGLSLTLPLSSPSGYYLVKIVTPETTQTRKVYIK